MSVKRAKAQEIHLLGEGISRGIAIGQPYFFSYGEREVPDYSIGDADREGELERFHIAIESSRVEIEILKLQLEGEGASDAVGILDAQILFFSDPTILEDISKGILEDGRNAEAVFKAVWKRYHDQFQSIADPFFRERFSDLQDLYRRVLRHMLGEEETSLLSLPHGAVVFAIDFSPSDLAGVQASNIGGFVAEKGGTTSHAAIVARAKGIPFVANLDISRIANSLEGPVIVDGRTGVVILNPKPATLEKYRIMQQRLAGMLDSLRAQSAYVTETFDGYMVHLSANLEDARDLPLLKEQGSVGIGLYRSEYLFLSQNAFPSEDEQFEAYKVVLDSMQGSPVVIRAFDVGGDKHAVEQVVRRELNPYLGCRAIRFLLHRPEIFRTQVRAVLRASAYGEVSLLFPMVSSLQELREVKNIIEEVKHSLLEQGHKVAPRLRVGSMIEVPSAALIADLLAAECDFLSIGTNDLVQYALAVDRSNDAMSGHYTPTHPGVLRLLKFIITQAHRRGVPVSLCGEMAADPRLTALLIGLGLYELSVATRHIPLIKNVIRRTSVIEARHLAEQTLAMSDSTQILQLLSSEYRRTVPEDVLYNPEAIWHGEMA